MSDYPTLKEYVLKDIELLEQDYTLILQQEIKDLVEKVLDVLPDFKFENGKPFYPSIPLYNHLASIELHWPYPAITKGYFVISFRPKSDPLSYFVYIAENQYCNFNKGTFESLCSELSHEFHKFCMDF